MIKAGKWTMTEEEFRRQCAEADRRGKEAMKTEMRARAAHYDEAADRLVIELQNGATHSVPRHLLQGLCDADPADVAAVELGLRGAYLRWEKLDHDITVGALVRGVFGTKKWMEQLASSSEKAQTSKTPSSRAQKSASVLAVGKRRRAAA